MQLCRLFSYVSMRESSPSAAAHQEPSLQPVITCSQPPHLHVGRRWRLAGTGEVVLHKRRDKRAGSHRGHVERTADGKPCIWCAAASAGNLVLLLSSGSIHIRKLRGVFMHALGLSAHS